MVAFKKPFLIKGNRDKRISNQNYTQTGLDVGAGGVMNPNSISFDSNIYYLFVNRYGLYREYQKASSWLHF